MFTTLVFGPIRYTVRTEHVAAILRMAPWLSVAPTPANDVQPLPMFLSRVA